MSRIAVTGNPLGTGTFTIASPNSNSDRVLDLPDAAGVMYAQGNILGTVSESSGVPTGAIIEQGSNANGEYVKYADGTMICTKRVTVSTAVATATGALFWTGASINAGATPATFSAVYYRNISVATASTALVAYFTGPSTNSFGSWYHLSDISRTSASYTYQYVQIGRWF